MTAPTKTYTATEEHLSALESDYMTKATISLIVNDIRNTPAPLQMTFASPGETRSALLEAYSALLKIDGRDCLLYTRIGQYDVCQSGCPCHNSDRRCGLRVVKSMVKKALYGVE